MGSVRHPGFLSIGLAALTACSPDGGAHLCRAEEPLVEATEVREPVTLHLSFRAPEPVFNHQLFVFDLTGDGRPNLTYRSLDRVYAFDHRGELLWDVPLANPQRNLDVAQGTAHGAADVTGDGRIEVLALDGRDRLHILDGRSGDVRQVIELPEVHPRSRWAYVAVANLRGRGDRDAILQTVDERNDRPWRYLNRNLLAWDLENGRELWRVVQGDDAASPWRGYWGPAHGPFRHADVTGDGRDEVLGGNMVTPDGAVVDLGYARDWIGISHVGFVDHLDAVLPVPLRDDLPGLQWIVTEEDHYGGTEWHTGLLSPDGLVWRVETDLFPAGRFREPQNVAAGRFDPDRPHAQIWVRSRFPLYHHTEEAPSQHPWVLDAYGEQIADWRSIDVLPPGFNQHEEGNCRGLEMISAIAWTGDGREHIAGKARHVDGNVGVFDALTGETVWYTPGHAPPVRASLLYVADVTADGREEVMIYDEASGRIQVYRNAAEPADAGRSRWEEPYYRRIKQNWNYYSP